MRNLLLFIDEFIHEIRRVRHHGNYKFNGWANKVKQEKQQQTNEERKKKNRRSEKAKQCLTKSDHYSVDSKCRCWRSFNFYIKLSFRWWKEIDGTVRCFRLLFCFFRWLCVWRCVAYAWTWWSCAIDFDHLLLSVNFQNAQHTRCSNIWTIASLKCVQLNSHLPICVFHSYHVVVNALTHK